MARTKSDFWHFYETKFLSEHTVPLNVALHVFGTLAGLCLLVGVPWAALRLGNPWLLLLVVLFPVVHAAPGLLGHRIFERSADPGVGDLRVTRTDFPPMWFLFGNHVMTFALLTTGRSSLQ
jgi:hypothetical protein